MVCALYPAHIATESVLVEFFFRFAVPEPARIGTYFVGENNSVAVSAEFYLKVDEIDADAREKFLENIVDFARRRGNGLEFLFGRPTESERVILVDHRVAEFVGFIIYLQYGFARHAALGQSRALGQRTRDDIAHDDLERNDLYVLYERAAIGKLLYVMSLDPLLFEHLHEVIAHSVIDNALAYDSALFKPVKRGRVVFVVYDEKVGIARGVHLFRLALVQLFLLFDFNVHIVFSREMNLGFAIC